ncbi:MAG: hypothetical protein DRJ03_01075 [Chloroflexi bacterium]|nr:MAG: hypothetical protein DRJ03_01075 [Chloroflexota bacterium]
MRRKKLSLFLDSGAFSAWSKNVPIEIDEYIQFIKRYKKHIEYYAVLDDINDPETTLNNQKIMEKAGLKPVPCFHFSEPIKYLKHYLDNYDFVALGGMVPISTPVLREWLDGLFLKYICKKDGMPRCKIHGFGMTSHDLMVRYPWYSVDSTSWVMTGRHGAIMVPRKKQGEYDYTRRPFIVDVSNKSGALKTIGKHIENFAPNTRQFILDYLDEKGFTFGRSSVKGVEEGYVLQEGERWFSRKLMTVEIIEEEGVTNNYRLRDEVNILFYLDFEKNLPKWPWPFKIVQPRRFGQ